MQAIEQPTQALEGPLKPRRLTTATQANEQTYANAGYHWGQEAFFVFENSAKPLMDLHVFNMIILPHNPHQRIYLFTKKECDMFVIVIRQ